MRQDKSHSPFRFQMVFLFMQQCEIHCYIFWCEQIVRGRIANQIKDKKITSTRFSLCDMQGRTDLGFTLHKMKRMDILVCTMYISQPWYLNIYISRLFATVGQTVWSHQPFKFVMFFMFYFKKKRRKFDTTVCACVALNVSWCVPGE